MPKVSVIICTKNSRATIRPVLDSVVWHKPYELVVVDAYSNDGTVEVAKQYKAKVVYDKGLGLGNARNIGLNKTTGDYIFYVGSDNILPQIPGLFKSMIDTMEQQEWTGMALKTITAGRSYIEKALNVRYKNRIGEGEVSVIGTPSLWEGKYMRKYKWNSASTWSDDTDLCGRMGKDGHCFGYDNVFCGEMGQGSIEAVTTRFRLYGRSDREYYKNNHKNWNLWRKILSLLHPFTELKSIKRAGELKYLPFFLYCIFQRYLGYAGIK